MTADIVDDGTSLCPIDKLYVYQSEDSYPATDGTAGWTDDSAYQLVMSPAT